MSTVTLAVMGACASATLRPALLRNDWSNPHRDPFTNPADELRQSPWQEPDPGTAPSTQSSPCKPDSLVAASAATLLGWVVGGWVPLVSVTGTFEEATTRSSARSPCPDASKPSAQAHRARPATTERTTPQASEPATSAPATEPPAPATEPPPRP